MATSQANDECKEESSYPEERSCYYKCRNSKLEKQSGPSGTFFSNYFDLLVQPSAYVQ
jgi:hypothetical protein